MTKTLEILNQLSTLQSQGDKLFAEGLLPTYRFHLYLPGKQADNNFFSTASIVFLLQNLEANLTDEEKKVSQHICERSINRYEDYRNKDGLKTYNFWKTDGSPHFPNGWLLANLNSVRIPDDVDDTSLIYLTKSSPKEDVLWLQQKLRKHANLNSRSVQNTFPEYKGLKAYSTFFGKNMYIEFDACVLCNLIYLFSKNEIDLDEYGKESIEYLSDVLKTDKHLNQPFYTSASYPNSVIILYHYARLLAGFEVSGLSVHKSKVVQDLKLLLESPNLSFMDKVLAETALMKLGVWAERTTEFGNKPDFSKFYFYHAGMLTAFENSWVRRLAKYNFFHLKYSCEAHNWALLLEHEVLKRLN